MYVGSGETWRLRMSSVAYFERFWTGMCRHVSGRDDAGRSGLALGDEFTEGEFIEVEAWLHRADGSPVDVALRPLARLMPCAEGQDEPPGMKLGPAPVDERWDGRFRRRFAAPKPGKYDFVIEMPGGRETLKQRFLVRPWGEQRRQFTVENPARRFRQVEMVLLRLAQNLDKSKLKADRAQAAVLVAALKLDLENGIQTRFDRLASTPKGIEATRERVADSEQLVRSLRAMERVLLDADRPLPEKQAALSRARMIELGSEEINLRRRLDAVVGEVELARRMLVHGPREFEAEDLEERVRELTPRMRESADAYQRSVTALKELGTQPWLVASAERDCTLLGPELTADLGLAHKVLGDLRRKVEGSKPETSRSALERASKRMHDTLTRLEQPSLAATLAELHHIAEAQANETERFRALVRRQADDLLKDISDDTGKK